MVAWPSIRNSSSIGRRGSVRTRFACRAATVLRIPIAIHNGERGVSLSNMSGGLWLWLAVAGLGLFHGINPAMGWLFAAGLGLNRNSERVVWLSLVPIALGHALAVGIVLVAVLALGFIVEPVPLQRLAAV